YWLFLSIASRVGSDVGAAMVKIPEPYSPTNSLFSPTVSRSPNDSSWRMGAYVHPRCCIQEATSLSMPLYKAWDVLHPPIRLTVVERRSVAERWGTSRRVGIRNSRPSGSTAVDVACALGSCSVIVVLPSAGSATPVHATKLQIMTSTPSRPSLLIRSAPS